MGSSTYVQFLRERERDKREREAATRNRCKEENFLSCLRERSMTISSFLTAIAKS
jgi:hypothetical protein